MENIKEFFSLKILLSLLLSVTTWILYYLTDFKAENLGVVHGGYVHGIVIYMSLVISLVSSIYFTIKLADAKITNNAKRSIVFILAVLGLTFLYCKYTENVNFFKQVYSFISLFSLNQIIILILFGTKTYKKNEKLEIEPNPVGAAANEDSEDDGLDQTKLSLNIDDVEKDNKQ